MSFVFEQSTKEQAKAENQSILIMIPVFNDWKAVELLLICLDEHLYHKNIQADVLIIDDASSIPIHQDFVSAQLNAIKKVEILELRRNVGHQRAIAIGLAFIEANVPCQAVVVMDGDGEDEPRDVIRLIQKCQRKGYEKAIFARRSKRSESSLFKLFYIFYKRLYKLLTGHDIRVGNFSIIPFKVLRRLVVVSELWNHYAVGLLRAKIPYTEISSSRGIRLAGKPKMNFVSLITHGLSAISVYGDVVGVRLLVATGTLIGFAFTAISLVLMVRFATNLAIPGWTSYIVLLLFIVLMQAVMLSLFFSFIVLNGRDNLSFLPKRDYHYFIMGVERVFPKL
ncbi:glycosyltransferase [Phormidium sp. LEGE 05292]|uniref:glycosyltransferase n=1 Tax=[Phormidium] sp. LEGE 05292 TaxID=767427 RepID=UPI0018803FE1|nr:glycosyltransferase [Phormidium sp. LEGE 05292]MBE9227340.1 glycosyltransferase [Phormidium sp. LEGE 05292]